jgi:NAD(P)-dependent dehydrogenase (short-subunit alcohol dehydrogenase family)
MAKGNGKIALVADASSGSGEATTERLAKAGYKVYGISRRGAQTGERPFEILRLGGTSDDAVGEVVRRDGRIDLIVNNVGFAHDYARRSWHSCSPAASM